VVKEVETVLAKQRSGQVVAVGRRAARLAARRNPHLEIIHPIQQGRIVDEDALVDFLQAIFQTQHEDQRDAPPFWLRWVLPISFPRITSYIPLAATRTDRQRWRSVCKRLGATRVQLPSRLQRAQQVFASDGSGEGVQWWLRLGYDETVLSQLTNNLSQYRIAVGMAGLEEAIQDYIRREHELEIGSDTLARIMQESVIIPATMTTDTSSIDTSIGTSPSRRLTIRGKHVLEAVPSSLTLSSEELQPVLETWLEQIQRALQPLRTRTKSADLKSTGPHPVQLALTGPGSTLVGMSTWLEQRYAVQVQRHPRSWAVRGAEEDE
jgi:actin-like ATPase involved in cell morphogenesis